jgi:NAD+ diphosphatase
LTRSPSELYYAKYEEVRKLVPQDFFDHSEEDMIKTFDSRKTDPTMIFLGMDESRKEGSMSWKIYSGVPYFALDVTPRGSEAQQTAAKDVISAMEEKGLSFFQTRIVTTFTPDEGMFANRGC